MRWIIMMLLGMYLTASVPSPPQVNTSYLPFVTQTTLPRHGLAWSYISLDTDAFLDLGAEWYYHWGSKPTQYAPADVFVPMLWSDDKLLKYKLLQNFPQTYNGYILFANEPEFSDQANMTVEQVADLLDWIVFMYPEAMIVGPQSHVCWYRGVLPDYPLCPYGPTSSGFTIAEFVEYYHTTRGHYPPIHAYGLHYGDTGYWPDYLHQWFMTNYDLDVSFWYTEFNHCNPATFADVLDALRLNPYVERYAYWTNLRSDSSACALYDFQTLQKTKLGEIYTREAWE